MLQCLKTNDCKCDWVAEIDCRTFDVSKNSTLLRNMNKMPWEKVRGVLLSYLKQIKIIFERSESLINPERRINGVKVDDRMIQIVLPLLVR